MPGIGPVAAAGFLCEAAAPVDAAREAAARAVPPDTPYRALVDTLVEHRVSAVPVVDDFQRVTGVVSEADLLRKIEYAGDDKPRVFESRHRRGKRSKAKARIASELMTSPPVSALSGTTIADAARMMDSERVKRLPVVDEAGRLVGIVTRGDLLKVHLRPDDAILADVRDSIVRAFLADDSENIHVEVEAGVVALNGKVDRWSSTNIAGQVVREVPAWWKSSTN